MRRGHRAWALVGASVMLAGLFPATQATAQTTYDVRVGRFLRGAPAESMRFLPESLTVHPGDVLHFTSEGFHTATLLPAGIGADDWVQDFSSGLEEPWSFLVADPDEPPGNVKANNRVLFPTDPSCGAADAPCQFDGGGGPVDGVLNSGIPLAGPLDFSVEVTADPGDSFWVICLIHPKMQMRVRVVAAGEDATDPSQAAQERRQLVARDTDHARALHARLNSKRTSHKIRGGGRVWDAWAGFDTHNLSLYAFYPNVLRVNKGDRVRWRFDALYFEDHTVTGPNSRALRIAGQSFVPVCDPDGDVGPGPDNPPDTQEPPFCSDPAQLEFDIRANFVLPHGNGTVTRRKDLESSGVLGSNVPGPASYDLTFARRLDGPYKYLCLIHPFMRGRVLVK
jgi:plastocyanin